MWNAAVPEQPDVMPGALGAAFVSQCRDSTSHHYHGRTSRAHIIPKVSTP